MIPASVIDIAKAELGYTGKKSNDQLDDKTANITGKFTKYARDLYEAGYYNGNKNGYDWCCVFVDWCFWVACGRNKELAEKVKPVGDLGAAVVYSYNLLNSYGRISNTPQVGSQIYYKNTKGQFYHTGLVCAITDTTVETIEGNWSNKVSARSINKDSSLIAGYGLPFYDEAPTDKKSEILLQIAKLFEELAKEF